MQNNGLRNNGKEVLNEKKLFRNVVFSKEPADTTCHHQGSQLFNHESPAKNFVQLRGPNPNSRGHATKRGLRVPNPNPRDHATKRGLRVPNPTSRGHARKRGLRVPNPNLRDHATKRGLRVPNPKSKGHATQRRLDPERHARGQNQKWRLTTTFSGAQKKAELLCNPWFLGDPQKGETDMAHIGPVQKGLCGRSLRVVLNKKKSLPLKTALNNGAHSEGVIFIGMMKSVPNRSSCNNPHMLT